MTKFTSFLHKKYPLYAANHMQAYREGRYFCILSRLWPCGAQMLCNGMQRI